MLVNMLLIFFILSAALLGFYVITWLSSEQSATRLINTYMSMPLGEIHSSSDTPHLFISEIDVATYDYIQPLIDSNIFKYFKTSYAHDSFSSSQTNNILSEVVAKDDIAARIRVDDRFYKYQKQKINGERIKIVVLDVTTSTQHLRSTAFTLITIALVSLIFVYFVSKLITELSVKPIEEMFKRQGEFFSDISHELRTPLTAAITNLAVIQANKAETVQSQEKWVGFLKDQLDRLVNLVNEMLYLEDIGSGVETNERINFSELVEQQIKGLSAYINEKGLGLNVCIQEEVYYHGELEALTRLVSVLVDNAIKYTPEGGSISLNLAEAERRVYLTVENSGEGIEPEDLDRVFDRFYRVRKSRSRNEGGQGLGLAIAKSVVEKYGGTIKITSTVGANTIFSVELPI
jgi:signal transduction histidine kinase